MLANQQAKSLRARIGQFVLMGITLILAISWAVPVAWAFVASLRPADDPLGRGDVWFAFPHLSDELLAQSGILYVEVSFEESLRKNRKRFNPDRPDSILEHGLPDAKLEWLYSGDDWRAITADDEAVLTVRAVDVPYVIFENEDDVTTGRDEALGQRLEERLELLWRRITA